MVNTQNPYKPPESPIAEGGAKRQRSRFWIVSTHVITTTVAMPAMAAMVGAIAVARGKLQGDQKYLVMLAFQAGGYIIGTFYSLSYLRKATAIIDAPGCTRASVITFGIFALLGFAANVAVSKEITPLRIAASIVFYVVVFWAFAQITRRGFAAMASPRAKE